MQLDWIKCTNDAWCGLNSVDLSHSHFNGLEGVYVIWHGGNGHNIVKVGQGNIADRLTAYRNDPKIQAYAKNTLYVTWAKVDRHQQDGVEAFLGSSLAPLVAERFPDVQQMQVNLPGHQ